VLHRERRRAEALRKISVHVYEVRPRRDHRGVDLISDVLPFGRLWYGEPNAVGNAIGYAQHRSQSHDAVIRVSDAAGNVIERHEHKGEFKEWGSGLLALRQAMRVSGFLACPEKRPAVQMLAICTGF